MTTCLVTGANRGIGFELAKQLHERGHRVLATCRKASDELNALGVEVLENVDVSDEASCKALAERVSDEKLDIVINNAGLLQMDSLEELNIEGMRRQFEVNTLGPLRVTNALLPKLGAGSKVALITSRMGSIADNTSGGMYGYRMSKAALNMAGTSMAQDLKKKEIAVGIYHPGMVATDMTARFGGSGMQSASDTAGMLIQRIDELSQETSGEFRHAKGETLPW